MGESLLGGIHIDVNSAFLLAATLCAFLIPVVLILPPVAVTKSDALLQTHSKAGVKGQTSNLRAQYNADVSQTGRAPKVHSLVIYPVKSCKGIEVTRSKVLPQGLEFDRLFTFAQLKSPFPVSVDSTAEEKDQHKWEFVTQRQFPRLATVKVDLWLPDEMKLRQQSMKSREAFVILRFPWKEGGLRGALSTFAAKLSNRSLSAEPEKEILLPVDFPSIADIKERGYEYDDVKIWKETTSALNMEKELPEELRLYLGVSNKLAVFRVDPNQLREVFRCAPRKEAAGYQPVTGFQDAYPLHMMNLNSVQEFSKELPKDDELKQLDVLRFRANIIISCAPAYDEDTWKRARLKPVQNSGFYNDAVFHVSCRTVRCKMPNVDQANGIRHPTEPDKSLRAHRAVDEGAPLLGCLGMQMTPLFDDGVGDDPHSWVAVGMTIDVEERGHHVYIKQ
ncbi:hypothetical protein F5Y15DRAFT_372380 [Xylariaceae sp. FL0016]|nr:hypothetical protein F5Y15DRAFT_372380 [Xylariaceae sp. FL0016]